MSTKNCYQLDNDANDIPHKQKNKRSRNGLITGLCSCCAGSRGFDTRTWYTFVLTIHVFAVVWAFVLENCVSGSSAQDSILVWAVVCEEIVYFIIKKKLNVLYFTLINKWVTLSDPNRT